jgi:hypothetical protein
MHLFG